MLKINELWKQQQNQDHYKFIFGNQVFLFRLGDLVDDFFYKFDNIFHNKCITIFWTFSFVEEVPAFEIEVKNENKINNLQKDDFVCFTLQVGVNFQDLKDSIPRFFVLNTALRAEQGLALLYIV